MGYDVQKLLDGAKKIRFEFFDKESNIKKSLLKKASFYAEHMLHYNINALFSYSELFRDFNAWYVQLWAESLGKKQLNSALSVGLTPVGLIGPTDQHSFLQLIVEGPKDKTVTFLKIKNFNDDTKIPNTSLEFLENLDIVNEIHQKNRIFFAIDDFGSGYSSLKTVIDLVKRKILKVLKIDGSLVINMNSDEYLKKIIKIISQIGHEFYILTVAEFVENEKVLEYLKDLKVNLAQGYYLSLPKTIEELLIEKAEKFRF